MFIYQAFQHLISGMEIEPDVNENVIKLLD